MQITTNSLEAKPGPDDWLTGSVYMDAVAIGSRLDEEVGAATVAGS